MPFPRLQPSTDDAVNIIAVTVVGFVDDDIAAVHVASASTSTSTAIRKLRFLSFPLIQTCVHFLISFLFASSHTAKGGRLNESAECALSKHLELFNSFISLFILYN